jgi:pimeloyl-ACP methyl ester carboxylesterase
MPAPSRSRRSAVLVLLVAVAVLLAGCGIGGGSAGPPSKPAPPPPGVSGALRGFYTQHLDWSACGSGFQCGWLRVPLDYDQPAGATIKLAVTRKPAGDQDHRVGSLLVNPGGPGGSGIGYARSVSDAFSDNLRERFDIVGFDPRGVGQSAPVRCLDDRAMDTFAATDPDPTSPQQIATVSDNDRAFVAACQRNSANLLPHVGTPDVARDMDVLRGALGDQRLYYLGKSYGTYIGAVYAGMFPTHVGRMVLDGAIDPRLSSAAMGRAQAAGFELALHRFVADCVAHADCPLGHDATAARQQLSALLTSIEAHPLPGDSRRPLTEALAVTGISAALYDEQSWPSLRQALTLAVRGDGRGLLVLSDSYYERDSSGHYSNEMAANNAVNCLDHPDVTSIADVQRELPALSAASPLFGPAIAWGSLVCAYWPVRPESQPAAITAAGAPPILVVGTTRDPATPYAWAQGLAGQLASGRLLTFDGDGHTAYERGSGCVDTAVDRYLLAGQPPAAGTTCH